MSLIRLAAGAAAFLAVVAVPFYAQSYPFGGPAGFDGHVLEGGEGRTCTTCHTTFALNSGTGGVTISAPASVLPGQTVPITVSVTNTTTPAAGSVVRQGFQASVRDHATPTPGTGNFVGALSITDAENTGPAFGGDTNYVGHTVTGTSQTSWTFDWTAPAESGVVATVYAAGNAANGGDGSGGDYIYTTTATIAVMATAGEAPPAAPTLALTAPSPNPVRGTASARLTLASASTVAATLVDGRGRTVRALPTQRLGAGTHTLRLPAQGLAPGTYFVVVEADGQRQTQPLVVAR